MPRDRRAIAKGEVVHARSRFVNGEFLIQDDADRQFVRSAMAKALRRCDTLLLAFAIMSSHIHVLLRMGDDALAAFYRSFHTALAKYLNTRHQRLGHALAGRPGATIVRGRDALGCLRYIHRNQHDAKAAVDLKTSDWTSHPLFRHPEACPEWVALDTAAEVCGFDPTPAGLAKFVAAIEHDFDGTPYEPTDILGSRAAIRRATGGPVEIATPIRTNGKTELRLVTRGQAHLTPRVEVSVGRVIAAVGEVTGTDAVSLRSKRRHRALTVGRALALHVWSEFLGQPAVVMASALGLSESGASRARRHDSAAMVAAMPLVSLVVEALGLPEQPIIYIEPE